MMTSSDSSKFAFRKAFEIEFSEFISKEFPLITAFAETKAISAFEICFGEEVFSLKEDLLDLCLQSKEKNIACRIILPYLPQDETAGFFRSHDIDLRFRICTGEALSAFLAEKEQYPQTEVELYYDRTSQYGWNISEAMMLCRQNDVPCCFGCSESYISASAAELQQICGAADTPFPCGSNCMRFAETIFIAGDGIVYPCRGLKDLPVADLAAPSFADIIDNSTVLSFYSRWSEKIKTPCRGCSHFSTCAGCRARAYQYSGDFLCADPQCGQNTEKQDSIIKLPVNDPENYLPHQHPMLQVSELLKIHDNVCETRSAIREDNPFLQPDGTLHPSAFIEIGAQSMAFLDAFLHPYSKLQGMLVEVSRFEYSGTPVRTGTCLKIVGEKVYEMPPWNIGAFKICLPDEKIIASGEVKVCQFQNP